MRHLLYFVIPLFLIISCSDELPLSTGDNQLFKIRGKVSYSSNFISGVLVKIDSSINTISDINGYFEIDSLKEGTYDIFFSHDNYKKIDTTIILKTDLELNIVFQEKMIINYFPLSLGQKFNFEYTRVFYFSGVPSPVYEICDLSWSVFDIIENEDTVFYSIEEELVGQRSELWWNDNEFYYDTTYSEISRNFEFIIKEYNNEIEFIKKHGYSESIYLDGYIINHKRNDFHEDLLVYENEVTKLKLCLRKNMGIEYMKWKSAGGNNWDSTELIRIY